MNYDPRRTQSFHEGGRHEYVINRAHPRGGRHRQRSQAQDAREDRHHLRHQGHGRHGGAQGLAAAPPLRPARRGGRRVPVRRTRASARLATTVHECRAADRARTPPAGSSLRVGYKVLRRGIRPWTPVTEGAWHGNDTTWRMAMDLARIVTYADAAGVMHDTPPRGIVVLTDGIIGGEGDGPYMSHGRPQRHPRLRRRPLRRGPRERGPDGLRPGPHPHGPRGGAAGEVPADQRATRSSAR